MGKPGKPTKNQRALIRKYGYDPSIYLVVSNEPYKIRLINAITGEKIKIKKNPAEANCQGSTDVKKHN